MIVEFATVALLVAAWKRAGKKKGEFTPEREKIYLAALENLDPERLRKLADVFESEGLVTHAAMLRKRADLRATPNDIRVQRKEAYEKGMCSENIDGVLKLANAFERLTATGAAANLRKHVEELKTKKGLESEGIGVVKKTPESLSQETPKETPKNVEHTVNGASNSKVEENIVEVVAEIVP
jgi:hypothetical protein